MAVAAMTGPFNTPREAAESVRHITLSPPGAWKDGNHRLIDGACRTAGVQFGTYDEDVGVWLAGQEPWVCAGVAGVITRGAEAGLRAQRQAETGGDDDAGQH